MRLVDLPLSALTLDPRCQMRVELREDYAAELAEVLLAPEGVLPPVVVFHESPAAYWVADGFHRCRAHALAGVRCVRCDVREGTIRDAVLFAAGANGLHGMRRNGNDKRKAVLTLLDDEEWGQWSSAEIARRCSVDPAWVGRLKRELSQDGLGMRVKVQRGGTEYEMAAPPGREPAAPDYLREAREGLAVAVRALDHLGQVEALGLARAALEALNGACVA